MKKLSEILKNVEIVDLSGSTDIDIASVCFDSRKVEKNSLFIATKGTVVDGHNFITQAIRDGARSIIHEENIERKEVNVTYVKVKDSSYALGSVASNFYDNPSAKLKLVGITGTNGKTTVATLLYNLFIDGGYKAGLISTVRYKINNTEIKSTHTTPDSIQLNAMLSKMVEEGCGYCFMEVSSHSVVQNRIAGLEFAGGVFTNLTHDHLDYHKTFEEYLKAKKKFFDGLGINAFALSNIDDKNGHVMLQNTKALTKYYSLQKIADFKAKVVSNEFSGLQLDIDGVDVWCKLVGNFNAYNLLAIYGTAVLLGEDKLKVLSILSNLNPVEGRFEYFTSKDNITSVVDYAHTPDALSNVISSILKLKKSEQQLITVVGCGGDRDATKRPVMGRIAAENSDRVILTSDNPRSEDPEQIIAEMEIGIEKTFKSKVLSIVNRREAIKAAAALAKSGDIILIAGKGHETYQEIKGVKHHFDDREIIKEIMNN